MCHQPISSYTDVGRDLWQHFVLMPSMLTLKQCMTLNIFKDCHVGYSNLKIYSPI